MNENGDPPSATVKNAKTGLNTASVFAKILASLGGIPRYFGTRRLWRITR